MLRFCRWPCLRDFRFFAVCLKLHFSTLTVKTNEKSRKMMSWGLIGGLEVLPALAVPCGFASAASFVCFVFYRQSALLWSPVVSSALLGSPGLSSALLGSSGVSWALLGSPGLSWALVSSPGLSWALLGSPRLSWALLEMCSRPSVIPGCGVLTT